MAGFMQGVFQMKAMKISLMAVFFVAVLFMSSSAEALSFSMSTKVRDFLSDMDGDLYLRWGTYRGF
ncbi:hypothetical protein Dpep_1606 [Dethiosulfovibrio peptidovorans DSM 11002]|uniref:Uncharacterized protein n=2 Tax=Dethiosulfovibrio TaxID=47054 RepID=D2Z835_9BACT|nr:hypothetical protein Dpep_1606 [Dethiosulfovibrio peptidovorans DSM 11002]